jgi:hypothetical protein
MRRLPLALVLLLCAAAARAASPAELIACFGSLEGPDEDGRPLTEGRGQDLGRWEWAPPKLYTAIAVPERRGGREGFYFYGASSAEFVHFDTPRIPASDKTGAYRVVPLELRPKGEGRGYFHCTYRAVDAKGDVPRLDCDFTNRESKYYAPAVETLKGTDADWSALKTAAMERIMSVHAVFEKRGARYGEALARWRKRNAEPRPGWASAAGVVGMDTSWYFAKPDEPPRGAARKALAPCAALDDEYLGAAARTELKLLENSILPKP